MERDAPRLSEEERRYAATLADPAQTEEWLAAHIALRLLLERAAGAAWRTVPFARSSHGKPHLEGAPVAFSLSHVPGLALVAIAEAGTVGVDLERMRAVRMSEPRRGRIEAAAAALNGDETLPQGGDERFLQAWVRLEAFAKAEGCGIGRLLTRLGVSAEAAGSSEVVRERVARVLAGAQVAATRDVRLGVGLFAAVASGPLPAALKLSRLPASAGGLEALLA
jgi:phosphopantetheinyl transferase